MCTREARLFEEEKDRKNWCWGEGAYNVTRLPPLSAPFYSDRHFLNRARAYNDLFSFCALEISGGYRHPSGLSFFKIEGRMYHQVYSLDAPGQRFATKVGDVQFVNRCRLYIDDGEERRNIAMGRSLGIGTIDTIANYLDSILSSLLGNEPSVNAHLEFQVTSRTTHGNVLCDRNRGVEVPAVLSTDEAVTEPRRLTVWKVAAGRPSTIYLFSPLMDPLLYLHGTLGWQIGLLDNNGKKLSQYNYTRCLLLSSPRFSYLGRLSQAWQVEMFARYEEGRLRSIKFSQSRSSVQNAMRKGQLNEILDAQRNAPAGIQVREDITRTRREWRKAWQNLPPKFVYRWAQIHKDSLRECNGSHNTSGLTDVFSHIHLQRDDWSQEPRSDNRSCLSRPSHRLFYPRPVLYLLLSRVRRPEDIVVLVRPNRVCDELHRKFPLLISNI
ncbi:hypothetical protein J6590_045142 [Homalodisca vitripennis]|nr:hypothetical protein J6590_045142 [Homalodisca vitripennis]